MKNEWKDMKSMNAMPIQNIPAKTMTGMIDERGNVITGGVVKNENSTDEDDASASNDSQGGKPNDAGV
jgi:hypothetical protein